eukprot:PLAT11416.2.p1 GENE.PLAT11416.2~~PLAT11416.2.p1  ORF type:complete len:488 (+),score=205.01 PLAT11416.2:22-1464(+)
METLSTTFSSALAREGEDGCQMNATEAAQWCAVLADVMDGVRALPDAAAGFSARGAGGRGGRGSRGGADEEKESDAPTLVTVGRLCSAALRFAAAEEDVQTGTRSLELLRLLLKRNDTPTGLLVIDTALTVHALFATAVGDAPPAAAGLYGLWTQAGGALHAYLSCLEGEASEAASQALEKAGAIETLLAHLRSSRPATVMVHAVRTLHAMAADSMARRKLLIEKHDALSTLVPTAAFALRAPEPPFPAGRGRCELVTDIMKLLFALGSDATEPGVETIAGADVETMTQLGFLLVELLRLRGDMRKVHPLKMHVVFLLMYMPRGYAHFLTANDCIPALLELLEKQVDLIAVERRGLASRELTPLLLVLNTLVGNNLLARQMIKLHIFPSAAADEAAALGKEEGKEGEEAGGPSLDPTDAPKSSLRGKLIGLLTTLDDSLRAVVGELLWVLCDSNEREFSRRVGLGPGMNVLRSKRGMVFG